LIKLQLLGYTSVDQIPHNIMNGATLPENVDAFTMVGYKRLCNIEQLMTEIKEAGIKGDVIETGVWKGGASIYMKYMVNKLKLNVKVYVADSFKGLPEPTYIEDHGDVHSQMPFLSVSKEQVMENFKFFELLDDNVIFLEGWFKDTLKKLKNKFSLIRLDGDMYESTMDAIKYLYPLLNKGGFVIVDDYNVVEGCFKAITKYRKDNNITSEIIFIDEASMYWKK